MATIIVRMPIMKIVNDEGEQIKLFDDRMVKFVNTLHVQQNLIKNYRCADYCKYSSDEQRSCNFDFSNCKLESDPDYKFEPFNFNEIIMYRMNCNLKCYPSPYNISIDQYYSTLRSMLVKIEDKVKCCNKAIEYWAIIQKMKQEYYLFEHKKYQFSELHRIMNFIGNVFPSDELLAARFAMLTESESIVNVKKFLAEFASIPIDSLIDPPTIIIDEDSKPFDYINSSMRNMFGKLH